jgi:hypothetical protein
MELTKRPTPSPRNREGGTTLHYECCDGTYVVLCKPCAKKHREATGEPLDWIDYGDARDTCEHCNDESCPDCGSDEYQATTYYPANPNAMTSEWAVCPCGRADEVR